MLRAATDLVLHLISWILAFGVGVELLEAHPQMFLLIAGWCFAVLARGLLRT